MTIKDNTPYNYFTNNAIIKLSLVLLFFTCANNFLFSQSGPAGVGNTSSNIIWLDASKITGLNDGDQIASWIDYSGNSNDVSQPTSTLRPYYYTNKINGHAIIRFSAINDRLRKTAFATFPTTAITSYMVHKNNGESNDATLSYASTVNNNDFLLFNSSNVSIYRANQSKSTGTAINDNAWHIIGSSWRSSDGNTRFYKDGLQTYTTNFQAGTSITANGCLAIAAEQDAVDGGYDATQDNDGDYAEILIFNMSLNQAQRIIVENYLSSKYNLNITAAGNDYFSFDATHGNELAGIGRESATDTHTSAQSGRILQISNPSGLDIDKEYLLFGHDNTSISAWTTTESPDGGVSVKRLAREWKCNETGEVGTVTLTVDTTLLPARSSGTQKFVLLVDADGDFSSGALVYEMCSAGADQFYEVSGLNIADGQYLSIGIIDPKFEFTYPNSFHFETDANFTTNVEVNTNYIACSNTSVNYDFSNNTATNPADYVASSGTVTINAGSSTANISITIVGDLTAENTEFFTVSLLDGGGFPYDDHTLTIYDNDNTPKIQFNTSTSTHTEADGIVNITVIRNGDNSVVSSCDYRLRIAGGTGTATNGADYNFAASTVTFNIGENSKTIPITILEDLIYENDETVILELFNVSAGTDLIAGGTEHTATITDNDLKPTVQYSTVSGSGFESVSPVSIQVELSALAQVDANVDYLVTGGTATGGGTDYTLAMGTLTIPAGSLTNNIVFNVTDDALQELPETIEVTLRSPVNATSGIDSIYTYTIEDNDLFGYKGPGGVGNVSNNVLWLQADKITGLSDGNDITSWLDNSGNANDFVQSNTTYTPRYYSNVVNSKPVVRFNQADHRFRKTNFVNAPTTEITAIYVNYTSDNNDGVLSYASSASDNEFLIYNNSNLAIYRGASGNRISGQSGAGTVWRTIITTWNSSNGNTQMFRNGNLDFNANNFATGTAIAQNGCMAIGGEQDAIDGGYTAGQSHQGDIPEVIIYNTVLNSAQRIIVENYLSSKYGHATANDRFAYDATYGTELAGIGRDDVNNFHIDAKGPAMVRINNPSGLDDGEYLLWGHDNASTSNPNTTDVPTGIDNRLNRVWRADETGDVGTVRIYFDLSGYTINDPDSLVLLIDSDDGSFVNATILSNGLTFDAINNIVYFTGVNLNAGDWFTVASKSNTNPLPIELIYFNANIKEEKVILDWSTASEYNNDYFIVERADESLAFKAINQIKGAGNSNTKHDYSITDDKPLEGVSYYRIKQIDFDGKFSYSDVKTINFNTPQKDFVVHIFPNPNKNNIFNISYSSPLKSKLISISIYDINGKCVENKKLISDESPFITYPHHLSPGIYAFYITVDNQKHIQKVIVQ